MPYSHSLRMNHNVDHLISPGSVPIVGMIFKAHKDNFNNFSFALLLGPWRVTDYSV